MTDNADPILLATTQIVSAWLGAHAVATEAIPDLIRDVHQSLTSPDPDRPPAPRMKPSKASGPPNPDHRSSDQPAVDIKKSVFSDHLICLEDGKPFKTLKRHLNEAHGMTPDQYRAKWDLPGTYPMIAPNHSAMRSRLSKEIGLGKRR
jgi:predicted transcriptional regulator